MHQARVPLRARLRRPAQHARRGALPDAVPGHAHVTADRAVDSRHMDTPRLRVGQPITPEQFELLSDVQLERLVPRAQREFFPGKDFCADGCFYLHDGTVWSFYKGGFLDE
jgi:hypothetical protein